MADHPCETSDTTKLCTGLKHLVEAQRQYREAAAELDVVRAQRDDAMRDRRRLEGPLQVLEARVDELERAHA